MSAPTLNDHICHKRFFLKQTLLTIEFSAAPSHIDIINLEALPFTVFVDLRVSRIYRHLAASPSFGGQLAKEMPLYGDNMKDS